MTGGPPWFDASPGLVIDGRVMRVREPSTPELVRALLVPPTAYADPSGLAVVLACLPAEADRAFVFGRTIGDEAEALTLTQLQFIADELVEMYGGGGLKRWSIEHLWRRTMEAWPFADGELQMAGIDVLSMPFSRATAAVWAMWRRVLRHNEQEMERLTREMEKPPMRVIEAEEELPDTGFLAVEAMWGKARGSGG